MVGTELIRIEKEGRGRPPHLSHSQVNRYLVCPEQYRLYYVEGLRPKHPSANLVFGRVVHEALAALFQGGRDPVEIFLEKWRAVEEAELDYGTRDSWEKLKETGENLLQKFHEEELPKIEQVHAVEERFELDVTSLDMPVIGIVDLIADVEGERMVVDFKTSGSRYAEHEAEMSDQLTSYQLRHPEAKVALCVLVKTKTPNIEWQVAKRSAERLAEYLEKADHVAREISAGRFYKRPGMWCKWCDYLGVCLGEDGAVEENLVEIS